MKARISSELGRIKLAGRELQKVAQKTPDASNDIRDVGGMLFNEHDFEVVSNLLLSLDENIGGGSVSDKDNDKTKISHG